MEKWVTLFKYPSVKMKVNVVHSATKSKTQWNGEVEQKILHYPEEMKIKRRAENSDIRKTLTELINQEEYQKKKKLKTQRENTNDQCHEIK